jgi:hypothetical protein
MRRVLALLVAVIGVVAFAGSAGARVLRVGSFHGIHGQYSSIQAAVNAARPGDWILIGPGDYKTKPSSIRTPNGAPSFPAGVLITKRNVHIRGMNRNKVIIDGTRPGSAVCSRRVSAQNFGLRGGGSGSGYAVSQASKASGVNGVMVWKAANVSIENLTVCNFLGGARDAGNGIWWNGGANSGKVEGHGFYGAYLTATSTFFGSEATAATYGIFSSNWTGGLWDQTYASNFNDSGYYIGACRQICNQTVNHAHGEFSALGYSGSNSGGRLVIENSEFDNNEDGFDTNSQNGDNPPPQDGACPNNGISPITHTHSCWVFMHNYVHDNNNPNVPAAGSAAAGPVGTGMSVSGGRDDTIMDNRFVNNDAWGVIFVPYLDSGGPCTGGTPNEVGSGSCLYDEWGDALIGNTFSHNGSYGHPSNGDFGQINFESGHRTDCYRGNTGAGGASLSPDAAALQQAHPDCTAAAAPSGSSNPSFLAEVLCDSQVELSPGTPSPCPTGQYPRRTNVVMHPLPRHLKTMSNPCKGVPSDPWCRRNA